MPPLSIQTVTCWSGHWHFLFQAILIGSPLQKEESMSEKGFKLHLSQQFKSGFFGFQPHFLFPTKDFQKISEKQKGAMRRLWKVLWEAVRHHRNLKSFSYITFKLTKCVQPCPIPTPTNCNRGKVPVSLPRKYLLSGIWPAFLLSFHIFGGFYFWLLLTSNIKMGEGGGRV